jgi:hypothetical protein
MKRHISAAVVLALLVILPVREALQADAALYTVEDLGQKDGAAPTVTGMNASGHVSGYVIGSSGMPRAVLYTETGGWQFVPGASSFYSVATGINDNGEVVGYHHTGTTFLAFRYQEATGLSVIAPLAGGSMTLGLAIDADGNVVGQSDSSSGNVGFRAAAGALAVALPGLGGTATACGINPSGQIAGYGANADGFQHAFRIETNGTVTPIVPLEGAAGTAVGCAIDAEGRVGGRSTSAGTFRGFTFLAGTPVNVDTFVTSEQSSVESVAGGVAVGWFLSNADWTPHALVNTADGSSDLNDLVAAGSGWQLDQAFAVNAEGRIVGIGRLNGVPSVFRLTRVETADTTAPTITALSASPSSVTPPNNTLVPVVVSASATDDRDASPVCYLTAIDGHGAPAGDATVTGLLAGSVRARSGATYSFAVSCSDATGNTATGSVDVVVPADTTAPVIGSVAATPSTIAPPNGALVPVAVSVSATDDSGLAPTCSLTSISGTSLSSDDHAITGPLSAKVRALGGRTYTLNVSCSDAARNYASAAAAVYVPGDTTAPVIGSVVATPGVIWPPNGKMVAVSVSIGATDNVDALPQCSVKSVTAIGADADDMAVTGTYSANVRAEKNSDGSARIYTVKVTCADAAGNKSWGSTTVTVSKDGPTAQAHKLVLAKAVLKALVKKAAAAERAARKSPAYFSRGSSR